MNHRWVYIILALALIAGSALRLAGIAGKKEIGLDEGISLLVATGHEGAYTRVISEKTPPYGRWVPAAEWKRFILPEDSFCFARISRDLTDSDVHPPLYFWLLHIWFLLFGAGAGSGAWLNFVLFLPTAAALFCLARYCLRDSLEAALVVLLWSISPAVIQISWVARGYGLLVLWAILFIRQVIRLSRPRERFTRMNYYLLALFTTGGLLTHYSFFLPVTGGGVFLIFTLVKNGRRRLWGGLLSIGFGGLLAFSLHPRFYHSFLIQRAQSLFFPYGGITYRMERVFSSFLDFLVGNRILQAGVLVVFLAFIVRLLIINRGRRRADTQDDRIRTGFSILFFLAWIGGGITIFYLAGANSSQQMGRRYLSLTYPLLAFVPVFLFRSLGKARTPATVIFIILLLVSSTARVWRYRKNQSSISDLSGLLRTPRAIVFDTTWRGFIPRFIRLIPDNKPIFIAGQDYLLLHRQTWLDNLAGPSIYISTAYKGKRKGREKILDTISRTHEIIPVRGRRITREMIYAIRPK